MGRGSGARQGSQLVLKVTGPEEARGALTHGSWLVLAAAEGWVHTESVLEQLAWGTPAAGLAAG